MPSPKPSAVELRSITKVFTTGTATTCALRDISLTVENGEFVSVVGPSGCGKSTMLKLIAGLSPVTEGQVFVGGELITGPKLGIALMFQKPVLLPWRTVRSNVLLPVQLTTRSTEVQTRKAEALLDFVGLKGVENRFPYELSLGMQQRVALCRALIASPSLLLMDEPFASLDEITRERMVIELLRIWEREKKTVLFVTHSIAEAIFLSDRVCIMTEQPGSVCTVVPIDFARPRTIQLLARKEFAELSGELRLLLHSDGRR